LRTELFLHGHRTAGRSVTSGRIARIGSISTARHPLCYRPSA
jgi:hypothetical protein